MDCAACWPTPLALRACSSGSTVSSRAWVEDSAVGTNEEDRIVVAALLGQPRQQVLQRFDLEKAQEI
ncbi:hypothetical protein [Halomonas sp. MCCC 1A11062]|uniref:hypothetical protein n=1 Tax=Halomonas sp. MCCC 1A11062 TaxID=2733485 RepID=UPI001F2D3FA2|nr:hypothetical protein [Halomonas sp. MCCC 1A11062]MCE8040501.1 hypothetical protein [Halomonas sp. MCCC 1A11062]